MRARQVILSHVAPLFSNTHTVRQVSPCKISYLTLKQQSHSHLIGKLWGVFLATPHTQEKKLMCLPNTSIYFSS